MTPLNDRLIAVPVPQDATNATITKKQQPITSYTSLIDIDTGSIIRVMEDGRLVYVCELPKGEYTVLGLCDPKEIGFDCEPYVLKSIYEDKKWYIDYTEIREDEDQEWFDNPADSFGSLLQSKGLDSGHYLIIEKI